MLLKDIVFLGAKWLWHCGWTTLASNVMPTLYFCFWQKNTVWHSSTLRKIYSLYCQEWGVSTPECPPFWWPISTKPTSNPAKVASDCMCVIRTKELWRLIPNSLTHGLLVTIAWLQKKGRSPYSGLLQPRLLEQWILSIYLSSPFGCSFGSPVTWVNNKGYYFLM